MIASTASSAEEEEVREEVDNKEEEEVKGRPIQPQKEKRSVLDVLLRGRGSGQMGKGGINNTNTTAKIKDINGMGSDGEGKRRGKKEAEGGGGGEDDGGRAIFLKRVLFTSIPSFWRLVLLHKALVSTNNYPSVL